jgi:hypothetical protein
MKYLVDSAVVWVAYSFNISLPNSVMILTASADAFVLAGASVVWLLLSRSTKTRRTR